MLDKVPGKLARAGQAKATIPNIKDFVGWFCSRFCILFMLLRLQKMAFSEGKKLLILNKGLLVWSIPEQSTTFSRICPQKSFYAREGAP
jgi:hypothetical protein